MPNERPTVKLDGSQKCVLSNLRELISEKDHGIDVRGKDYRKTIHANRKVVLEDVCDKRVHASFNRHMKPLTNKAILAHCRGDSTTRVLFTGNEDHRKPSTLVMIDVDAKKKPAPDQCRLFLEYLEERFPQIRGLFAEPSASGNSYHGYFVLDKSTRADGTYADADEIRGSLRTLQRRLRAILKQNRDRFPDITDVEIKGQPMMIRWKPDRSASIRCGILGKLPSTILDRPDDFARIARVPQAWLSPTVGLDEVPVVARPRNRAQGDQGAREEREGSSKNHPMPKAWVDGIRGRYLDIARRLIAGPIPTSGKHVARVEDVAIYLAIAAWCTLNQDESGAMPSARIKGLWNALYEAGEVSRPHCVKRVAAIRNRLSGLGAIVWVDPRYWVKDLTIAGRDSKLGQCCRYALDPRLIDELRSIPNFRHHSEIEEKNITGGTTLHVYQPEYHSGQFQAVECPIIRPIRVGWASQRRVAAA